MGKLRGYQTNDIYSIKTVSDPQISPDGENIAYVVTTINRKLNSYNSAIWLKNKHYKPHRITSDNVKETQPRWSSDGSSIAFLSDRDGDFAQIYVMSIVNQKIKKLTFFKKGALEIVWSSSGKVIIATSRVNRDEKKSKNDPIVITQLKHKHNGQGFFDGSHVQIFVVPTDGKNPKQITKGNWDNSQVDCSPDGKSICFVSARHETRDVDIAEDLWTMPTNGGQPTRLTKRFGIVEAPIFSPNGQSIAFSGHNHPDDSAGRISKLWVISRTTGKPKALSPSLDRSVVSGSAMPGAVPSRFSWTPDAKALIARVQDGPNLHLYRFPLNGDSGYSIIEGKQCVEAFSLSSIETIACLITNQNKPPEVFLWEHDNLLQVTHLNDRLFSKIASPQIHDVKVELTKGTNIYGWIIKPLNFNPNKKYPLILDIHGGPHAAFMNTFRGSYPMTLASMGCAVLQMNPRGSTGWGEKFSRYLGDGRGKKDFPELLRAIEYISTERWIDTNRLGITGYSYGGFMTAWAITQTNMFKAAVWGAGVANLYTHYAYTDNTSPRYPEMGGSPWENRKRYMELSPISYVQNVRTPLLMLHGEADLRCNPAQADEFFTALKYMGNETVLVRYPGEHHGFRQNGRPSNRVDYDTRLINWFSERLQF